MRLLPARASLNRVCCSSPLFAKTLRVSVVHSAPCAARTRCRWLSICSGPALSLPLPCHSLPGRRAHPGSVHSAASAREDPRRGAARDHEHDSDMPSLPHTLQVKAATALRCSCQTCTERRCSQRATAVRGATAVLYGCDVRWGASATFPPINSGCACVCRISGARGAIDSMLGRRS